MEASLVNRSYENDNAFCLLRTQKKIQVVLFRELLYVDVSGHYLYFHLADGEIVTVYASMKEYMNALLGDPRFAHCHRSFIVNLDFIKAIDGREIWMVNQARLPISKKYLDIKKRYVAWLRK